MKTINYEEIESKYKKIIAIAKHYMKNIKDFEHDVNHMTDVVFYTKELINKLDLSINYDVCIISAYWHDVGRIKTNENHEIVSAQLLKETMLKYNYSKELIDECFEAIEYHGWNMNPKTLEGLIIKDANKLAWLGKNRWESC